MQLIRERDLYEKAFCSDCSIVSNDAERLRSNQAVNTAKGSDSSSEPAQNTNTQDSGTVTYQSEDGPVEVPKNPQRVVVLTRFLTGNVMALDVPLIGVDEMSKENPRFAERLKDVESVSDESLEKIMQLQPDLIIGLSGIANVDKLKSIAPTITYTYNKLSFLDQQIEIGKLLNKEKEARAWAQDFQARAKKAGEEIVPRSARCNSICC